MENIEFKQQCDNFRKRILDIAKDVKSLMEHEEFKGVETYKGQGGEMKANIMLTYRHLEDARMRVGKILQAADDGVSILDKQEGKRTCADCGSEALEDLIYCSKCMKRHNDNDKKKNDKNSK